MNNENSAFDTCKKALIFGFDKSIAHIGLLWIAGLACGAVWTILMVFMSINIVSLCAWIPSRFRLIVQGWGAASVVEGLCVAFIFICAVWIILFGATLLYGFYKIHLDLYDHDTSTVNQIFSQSNKKFTIFVASLIHSALISVGYMCLVVPGIILTVRLALYPYFIVDQNAGPIESLQRSWYDTSNNWGVITLLTIAYLLLIGIFGRLALLFIILFPIFSLAHVYVYRQVVPKQEIKE